jgi:hypothetical protein
MRVVNGKPRKIRSLSRVELFENKVNRKESGSHEYS